MAEVNASSQAKACLFLFYDPVKIRQAHTAYIVAAVINSLFILPAIVLNILLLNAMCRSRALRKPSTLLLCSLSASDLLLGLLVQPGYLAKKIGELAEDFNTYCNAGLLTYTGGNLLSAVSFLNLTAIAIDRYLLVTSGIDYSSRVTNKRVVGVIVAIWLFVIALVIIQFYVERSVVFKVSATIMGTCIVITTLCYVRAMHTIKKQQLAILNASDGPASQYSANITRYRKSTITMLLVFVVFLLCYTPYLGTMVVASLRGDSAVIWSAESITTVLAFINASLNPVILFCRMTEIRQAGKQTTRHLVQSVTKSHGKQIQPDMSLSEISKTASAPDQVLRTRRN